MIKNLKILAHKSEFQSEFIFAKCNWIRSTSNKKLSSGSDVTILNYFL